MADIKWTKSNSVKLGVYVSKFNKKIENFGNLSYFPKKIDYQKLKSRIFSVQEYNRNLQELQAFLEEGAEEKITLNSGEQITRWEKEKLDKEIKIATKRLEAEKKELEQSYKGGYSKAQMGYEEYRTVLEQIRDLQELEKRRDDNFTRLKDRISRIGTLDYKQMRATVYRENYMKEIKVYENVRGYDLLMKKLNRFKNSINFFKYITSSEVFSDLFIYYQDGERSTYNEFETIQDRFNYGVEELGLFEELKQKELKKLQRKEGTDDKIKRLESIDNFRDFLNFIER